MVLSNPFIDEEVNVQYILRYSLYSTISNRKWPLTGMWDKDRQFNDVMLHVSLTQVLIFWRFCPSGIYQSVIGVWHIGMKQA